MPFKIVIEIADREAKLEDIRRISHYLGEALKQMGFSYSLDCYSDGVKVVTGLEQKKIASE